MKYKAVIFDMDGTVVDTGTIWDQATRTVIQNRGVTISPELNIELKNKLNGLALPQSCLVIKELTNCPKSIEEIMQEKTAIALSLYQQGVNLIHGFTDLHAKIKELNLKIGLATNANDATLAETKRALKLEQFFGIHLYGISHVNMIGKPNPAIYLYAAEQLEVAAHECIAIEDSAHGIKAAKAAGMLCIGITTSKNPLQTQEADLIIDNYHELDIHKLIFAK